MSEPDASSQLVTLIGEFLARADGGPIGVSPECELKFGTRGVKPVTKIDFDNVVQRLLSVGFSVRGGGPKSILRMQPQYTDENM